MKFLALLFLVGCSANKAKMMGVVVEERMYFDNMVRIGVLNAPDNTYMWVKLSDKQLSTITKGDRVVFYVKTARIQHAE